jgi:DNA-binding LacI/PurR family transcriptional regulator
MAFATPNSEDDGAMARQERGTKSVLGRPADRSREIAAVLRGRIADGVWAPGSRIPTRVALCEEFTAGPTTIQRILADMESEGFILSNRHTGTHVAQAPPPCVNVAVVLHGKVKSNRFYEALASVAERPRTDGLRPIVYQQVDEHLDSPDSRALLDHVQSRRLMGILFATPPHTIKDSPIVTQPGAPCCIIMTPDGQYPQCSTVGFDMASFRDQALAYLKSRGRTRLAVVGRDDPSRRWLPAIADAGLVSHSWWMQALGNSYWDTCRPLAQLLFHPNQTERPDGLVILDDNTADRLTEGVRDMGIRVPDELDIVTQCNFPFPPAAALPVTHIGYDMAKLFEAALRSLAVQRRGEMPPHVALPAQFGGEAAAPSNS